MRFRLPGSGILALPGGRECAGQRGLPPALLTVRCLRVVIVVHGMAFGRIPQRAFTCHALLLIVR